MKTSNSRSFFCTATAALAVVVLLTLTVPVWGQLPPAENPALDLERRVKALEEAQSKAAQQDAAKNQQSTGSQVSQSPAALPPAAVGTTNGVQPPLPPPPAKKGWKKALGSFWAFFPRHKKFFVWMFVILVSIVILYFVVRRFRNRRQRQGDGALHLNTPREHGYCYLGLMLCIGLVLVGLLFATNLFGDTNACYNPATGPSQLPIAVEGQMNEIVCLTNLHAPINVLDESGSQLAISGYYRVGYRIHFQVLPTAATRLRVLAGGREIGKLTVSDKYGSYLMQDSSDMSTQRARKMMVPLQRDVKATGTAVSSLGTKFQELFGPDGNGGTIGSKISQLDQRMTALEQRPAAQVDMSAYDQRLIELQQQLAAARQEIADTKAQAQSADDRAKDAQALAEKLSLAKTGVFKRHTLLEDAEKAESRRGLVAPPRER